MKLRMLSAVLSGLIICVVEAHAQPAPIHFSSEETTLGKAPFLQQPSGTAGITKCKSPAQLTATRAYLVKNFAMYYGFASECLRIIINHKKTDESETQIVPTYLGVQIISFYDAPPTNAIVLKRLGKFTRNGKALPPFDDRSYVPEQLTLGQFNDWHGAQDTGGVADQALREFDGKIGAQWHGTPDGGVHNSWNERFRFRDSGTYDARISLRHKMLENRLIRFSQYPSNGEPKEGPLSFQLNRRGARVVAIRVFSPAAADIDRSFVIIYSNREPEVAQLINAQLAAAGWFSWFRQAY